MPPSLTSQKFFQLLNFFSKVLIAPLKNSSRGIYFSKELSFMSHTTLCWPCLLRTRTRLIIFLTFLYFLIIITSKHSYFFFFYFLFRYPINVSKAQSSTRRKTLIYVLQKISHVPTLISCACFVNNFTRKPFLFLYKYNFNSDLFIQKKKKKFIHQKNLNSYLRNSPKHLHEEKIAQV